MSRKEFRHFIRKIFAYMRIFSYFCSQNTNLLSYEKDFTYVCIRIVPNRMQEQ